jgi:copper chaperone CopZ
MAAFCMIRKLNLCFFPPNERILKMYRVSLYLLFVMATTAIAIQSSEALATNSKDSTTITLKTLDCESCAKKIAAKLSEVEGVDSVKTDVKSKVVVVTPKKNLGLSPLQLWEAIEKAGKEPVKLTGPGGTFTSKPKK